MPKNSPLAAVYQSVMRTFKSLAAPYTPHTRKSRAKSAKRSGGGKAKSGLRVNANEYKPYAEEFPALSRKKATKTLKKGEIWPASNSYKARKGSAALKNNNVKRGGATRRRY